MIEAAQLQSFLGMGTLGMCVMIYARLAVLEWKFHQVEGRITALENHNKTKGYTHGEIY